MKKSLKIGCVIVLGASSACGGEVGDYEHGTGGSGGSDNTGGTEFVGDFPHSSGGGFVGGIGGHPVGVPYWVGTGGAPGDVWVGDVVGEQQWAGALNIGGAIED